jgi:hypothetical protein
MPSTDMNLNKIVIFQTLTGPITQHRKYHPDSLVLAQQGGDLPVVPGHMGGAPTAWPQGVVGGNDHPLSSCPS